MYYCTSTVIQMRKYGNWGLIGILVLAAVLRLWKLGSVPPSLTPDEASLGYSAYSILKTGKDEYGKFLPIVFKSFGDYKPGFYVYLDVPFVATLGLNEVSTRLPSALAGIVIVYLIYLIVKRLFTVHTSLPTMAAFVAAINPWLIYFSRGAWEANVSLCLTLAGIYFFLKSFLDSRFLLLSSALFATTLIAYQGAKLSTLIILVILSLVYFKECKKLLVDKKKIVISTILGLVIVSPILISILIGQTGRLNVFSIFSYPRPAKQLQTFLYQGGERVGSVSYYLFHSESVNFARAIMGRWFNHFSGRFLFFEGDWQNPRHSAPNSGMMLLVNLITLVYGFVVILKNKFEKGHIFILLWLILASLPAALSRDQVHAVRALNMSVPLVIISAFGLSYLVTWISRKKTKFLLYVVLCALYAGSVIYFLDAYFVHLPKHNSSNWMYGYEQVIKTVSPMQKKYKTIKVQQSYNQPYIYFLYYQKYDPTKYQKQASLIESSVGDVGQVGQLDNIEFTPINWSADKNNHGILLITDAVTVPEQDIDTGNVKVLKDIYYLNGRDLAFRILEIK